MTRTERVPSFRHRISARRRPQQANALIRQQIPCQPAATGEAFVLRHGEVAAQDGDTAATSAARERPS